MTAKRTAKTVETHEYAQASRRFVRALGARLADGDPEDLAEIGRVREELEAATRVAVNGLREQGRSWDDIAKGLGITRQGAIKAYATDTNRGTRGARPLAQR